MKNHTCGVFGEWPFSHVQSRLVFRLWHDRENHWRGDGRLLGCCLWIGVWWCLSQEKNSEVLPLLNNLLENREMQLEVLVFFFVWFCESPTGQQTDFLKDWVSCFWDSWDGAVAVAPRMDVSCWPLAALKDPVPKRSKLWTLYPASCTVRRVCMASLCNRMPDIEHWKRGLGLKIFWALDEGLYSLKETWRSLYGQNYADWYCLSEDQPCVRTRNWDLCIRTSLLLR